MREKNEDVMAAFQLLPLLNDGIYLPFTNSSLNYSSISVFLNDVVINDRKFIVELGCGLTTLLIARLLKKNKLDHVKLLSIEENREWLKLINKLLIQQDDASDNVMLLYAELNYNTLCKANQKWYDTNEISRCLKDINLKIDSMLIDGPSAWRKGVSLSRYPALPFFHDYLNDNSIVFLDDANRDGERSILNDWRSFKMKQINYSPSFSGLLKGEMFNVAV